jgi:hypothetical protein
MKTAEVSEEPAAYISKKREASKSEIWYCYTRLYAVIFIQALPDLRSHYVSEG